MLLILLGEETVGGFWPTPGTILLDTTPGTPYMLNRLIVIFALFLIGCPPPYQGQRQTTKASNPTKVEVEAIDYIATLNSATVIDIKEYTLSIGKDYDIFADDVKVATVEGKNVRFISGDIFTLKDLNGLTLAYEEETKGLFQLNRSATVYDKDGQVTGYLGEDRARNFLSFSYVFYFYDANKNEIGKSSKFTNSSLGTHKIYNADGSEAYDVNKHLTLGGDHYTITVTDQNTLINRYKAILLVCIEDAIGDAAKKKKSSSDD